LINYGNLSVNYLGQYSNLYAIIQNLSQHIVKQGGEPFTPMAYFSGDREILAAQETQFSTDYLAEKSNVDEKVKKLSTIVNSINKQLLLTRAGEVEPDPSQRMARAGYVIQSPQHYSNGEYHVELVSPGYGSAQVFLSETNIRLCDSSSGARLLADPELLDRLLDVCAAPDAKSISSTSLSASVEKPFSSSHGLFSGHATSGEKKSDQKTQHQITKNIMLEFSDTGSSLGLNMSLHLNGVRKIGLFIGEEMQQKTISLINSPENLISYLQTKGGSSYAASSSDTSAPASISRYKQSEKPVAPVKSFGLLLKSKPLFKNAVEIKSEANKALHQAFLSGDMSQVVVLLERHTDLNLQPNQASVSAAIKSGNTKLLDLLETAFNLKPVRSSSNAMDAIESKNIDMLKRIAPTCRGSVGDRYDLSWAAARTGDIEILRFCVEQLRIPVNSGTLYDAVRSGEIKLVKYLVEEHGVRDEDDALQLARERNFLVEEQGVRDEDDALQLTRERNFQEIRDYLESMSNAARINKA